MRSKLVPFTEEKKKRVFPFSEGTTRESKSVPLTEGKKHVFCFVFFCFQEVIPLAEKKKTCLFRFRIFLNFLF